MRLFPVSFYGDVFIPPPINPTTQMCTFINSVFRRWSALSKEEKLKKGSLFKQLLLHCKKEVAFGLMLELVAVSSLVFLEFSLCSYPVQDILKRSISYLDYGNGFMKYFRIIGVFQLC